MQRINFKIPLIFALAKLLLHLFTNTNYGFHRDELLYLALGKHLDWGFWSNPPFIGLLSFLSQNVFGDSLFATRLFPALFGSATLFLICLMAKELGGKNNAQVLAGVTGFVSLAYLRSSHMFMPVVIDIFFWTLITFIIIQYLNSENKKWLIFLGVAIGVGFLNKYSVGFLVVALFVSVLLSPQRVILKEKYFWLSIFISFLIVFPNIIWQWDNGFPVIFHMNNLSETQLSTVNPFIFLLDQLLMHFWGFLVWLPGLLFLLFSNKMKKFKLLAWFYIIVLLMFLALNGKNYYTLGAYPVLMAAGGVFWGKYLEKKWKVLALASILIIGSLPIIPSGLPILSLEKSVAYFDFMVNDLGITSLTRWERGNIESLPQDYADMLGWEEIALLVQKAIQKAGRPKRCLVYGEHYGQAGAAMHYVNGLEKSRVVSFSDTYRLWVSENLPKEIDAFIYINDELGEDVANLFADIELIGEIEIEHSRQRGDQVYLCRNPRSDFGAFWRERVLYVRENGNE